MIKVNSKLSTCISYWGSVYSMQALEGIEIICYDSKIYVPQILCRRMIEFYHFYINHPGASRLVKTIREVIYWKVLVTQADLFAWKGFSNNISLGLFLQVYYHQGDWDRNGTNIAHVCTDFATRIFCYHSRLSRHHWELAWSNQILDPKCMYWVWNLRSSVIFVVLFV